MKAASLFFSISRKSVLRASAPVAILAGVFLSSVPSAYAPPNAAANCRGCHGTVQSGMYLTGNHSTTNVGAGLLKVYQVVQGQTAAIGLQLTNRYGSTWGLSLLNLTAPGYNTATNRLSYTGDATWANRTVGGINYFTLGASSGTFPQARTNNLLIAASTPADLYKVQFQMAGPANGEWSQVEDFYIQVLAAALPPPAASMLTSPAWANGQFSVTTATENGHEYFLEYKNSLADGTWTGVDQQTGNGTPKVLNDNTATVPNRFYRVRAQ